MMGWYGNGMGPFMWLGMGLFWIILLGLIVWLVTRLLPGSKDDQPTRSSGESAVEILYRGVESEHDWSGRLVVVARGKEYFTILGITFADSDLIQIQENVISRAISSMDFHAQ